MIKGLKFLFVGVLFGILLTKGEVISWYRIYEMFRFESFHMYGIIGTAVVFGLLAVMMIKKTKMNDFSGSPINIADKDNGIIRYLLGGCIFGLGWALTGACPAPIYVLAGSVSPVFAVVLLSAVLGTFTYGLVKDKLPH